MSPSSDTSNIQPNYKRKTMHSSASRTPTPSPQTRLQSSLSAIPSTPIQSPSFATGAVETSSVAASSTMTGAGTTQELTSEKSYWDKPGVNKVVEWMTDEENMKRRLKKNKTAGNKVPDLNAEIATFVNTACGFQPGDKDFYTVTTAKSKYDYIHDIYKECKKKLGSTGNGDTEDETLRHKILKDCPRFDDLDQIFGSRLSSTTNPAPRETVPQARATYNLDIEDLVDSGSEDTDFDEATAPAGANGPPKKKRKKVTGLDTAETILRDFKHQDAHQKESFARIMIDSHNAALADQDNEIRRRWEDFYARLDKEQAKAQADREAELKAHRDKLTVVEDEFRERWRLRGSDMDSDFKSRVDRLDADRAEWKEEKEELKAEVKELTKANMHLACENSALKKELEIRRRSRSPPEIAIGH
ncbi:MAG: hypothetical protein J3R72DRAFT_6724 [Linnemannia gamsii]|nr:MAG: hypothetical protein J3R72DRAFT_180720 [Linnemannia gamsii]KAK3845860.1 MAG: hypothetical protein J3R72DRAFT_6724 [Linnemannia gamsii]